MWVTAPMKAAGRMFPATELANSLKELRLLPRFKTGTPSRVNRRSVDFTELEPQPGDEHTVPFSFATAQPIQNSALCYITYTNSDTKANHFE